MGSGWGTNGALGLDTGSGYIPESVRRAKGFRVIESRPTTGGADLRRTDPRKVDRWFEQSEADAASARSEPPTSRDAIADAMARGRAYERLSRESISDAIARARATGPGTAARPESRSSERISTPARPTPRTGAERTGIAKTRSTPERTRSAAPSRSTERAGPTRTAGPTRSAGPTRPTARTAPRSSPRVVPRSSVRTTPRSSARPASKASPKRAARSSGRAGQ